MKKKITDIQIEGKHSSRRILFLDGKPFDSVDASAITNFGLRIGLEIEAEVLQKLIQADEVTQAKNYALDLLLGETYSKQQMMEALERKGFRQSTVDETLKNLVHLGYIKDKKYAQNWVQSRQRLKPRSRSMLRHELTKKGIDQSTVDRALEVISNEEEAKFALQIAQKQARLYRSLPPHVAKRRLHGFLQRRGFDYEMIQRIIEQVLGREA